MPSKKTAAVKTKSRPVCFVLMPFVSAKPRGAASKYKGLGKGELDTIFALLKRCLKEEGFLVKRAEGVGDILRDIVLHLDQAELVCAELSGLNPNVMYELGIRHGFTKKTILLTQDIEELPFDLRSYHAIEYGWITDVEQKKLRQDIRETLKRIREQTDTRFGPVHTHLGAKHLAIRDEEKRSNLRKLAGLSGELGHLWGSVKDVHTVLARVYSEAFEEGPTGWRVDLRKLDLQAQDPTWKAARERWSPTYPSIDLFMATQYLPDEFDSYGDIHAFTSVLGSLRLSMHSTDRSLKNFLALRNALDVLTDDVVVIRTAVVNDQYGQNLSLRCAEALRGVGQDKTVRSQEDTSAEPKEKQRRKKAARRRGKGPG